MQINQNVPSCVVAGTNNGCRPNSSYANNNQYSSAGRSVYDGLHVTFVQRPTRWGSYRVSYTYSKSMNNVGEAFFSSPIDPFDIDKDWGRSDDDQRHRLVVTGSINTSMAPATTAWQHVTHGFQLSGMVQYYSALPFNIASGSTTIQGTAGRPIVDGEFIERNAGVGGDFSTVSLRVNRTFRSVEPRADRRPRRGVQPVQSPQRSRAHHDVRCRRVSDESFALVRAGDGRGRSEIAAVRSEGQVLMLSRRSLFLVAGAIVPLVASACRHGAPAPETTTLAIPGRVNQTPSIAFDQGVLAVSWSAVDADGKADVYVVVSRDGGKTMPQPVRVNDEAGEVRASEQQAPRLALKGDMLAVLWTSRRAGQTGIRVAVSQDQGRTFAASRAITPDGAPGTRGWGALLIDKEQRVQAVWLDTRIAAAAPRAQSSAERQAPSANP